MGKWFARLSAVVIGGVLIYWLTKGLDRERDPPPPPPPSPSQPDRGAPRGYMVVPETGQYRTLEDLGAGATVCGSNQTVGELRSSTSLGRFSLRVVPAPELYQAWQTGICKGVIFREISHVNRIFPANLTGGKVIEFYD